MEYERLQRDYGNEAAGDGGLRDLPAETRDGFRVHLRANIGLLSDVGSALANGAEGVGLYRTEFPYMTRKSFPDRHEQYRALPATSWKVSTRCRSTSGLSTSAATRDCPTFAYPEGGQSVHGLAVHQGIAGAAGHLQGTAWRPCSWPRTTARRAHVPVISGVDEIRTHQGDHRQREGGTCPGGESRLTPTCRLGIMVELPAAVQTAEILIREVDYFSIGTNDLIQYTLAADRNNPKVKKYYDPYHPAVLHSIKRVADVANGAGKAGFHLR